MDTADEASVAVTETVTTTEYTDTGATVTETAVTVTEEPPTEEIPAWHQETLNTLQLLRQEISQYREEQQQLRTELAEHRHPDLREDIAQIQDRLKDSLTSSPVSEPEPPAEAVVVVETPEPEPQVPERKKKPYRFL